MHFMGRFSSASAVVVVVVVVKHHSLTAVEMGVVRQETETRVEEWLALP